jgi:hypothetical protein
MSNESPQGDDTLKFVICFLGLCPTKLLHFMTMLCIVSTVIDHSPDRWRKTSEEASPYG